MTNQTPCAVSRLDPCPLHERPSARCALIFSRATGRELTETHEDVPKLYFVHFEVGFDVHVKQLWFVLLRCSFDCWSTSRVECGPERR